MRVLVTGAGGFVGRHLVSRLQRSGRNVTGVDREEGDICDPEVAARVIARVDPDCVVHLAGQSSVARSFADPAETFRSNVMGTVSVLEAVRVHAPSARVIVASSAEVYGPVRVEDLPVRESHALAPATPYAASKCAQEIVARQYADSFGINVVVTRSFNAIGPGQSTDFALPSFGQQLAAIAAGRSEPELHVGNLSAERDFVDVRDVARAIERLVTIDRPRGAYNICSGVAVPIRTALDILIRVSGCDVRIIVDPERIRPVDVPVVVGDATRLREETGWAAEIPIEQSLADLFSATGAASESN